MVERQRVRGDAKCCAWLIGGCKARQAVRIFIPSFIIPLNILILSPSVTPAISKSSIYYDPADIINYYIICMKR